MSTNNVKQNLMNSILLVGLDGLLDSNPLLDEDETLLLLSLIESSRYLNGRNRTLKPLHWWNEFFHCENDVLFRNQFRMNRESFLKLSSIIEGHPAFNSSQDPVSLQLAVALYRFGTFGNGCGLNQVSVKFSISHGSVANFTERVIEALISLSKTWIHWPSKSEREKIGGQMASKLLPNCIGFVDGTDAILTDAPLENKEVYWSRKKKYAMQVQIICDPTKVIRDLFVGYPGSVHDAKVYTSSPIGLFPTKFFSEGEYLVGDAAYPLSDTVITPYRNSSSGLSREKRKFNYHLSTHRVAVEHTIGMLKSRFQSIKGLRIRVDGANGHEKVCRWIHACCILHNMLTNDPWDGEEEQEIDNNPEYDTSEQSAKGNLKRETLLELFKCFKLTNTQ